MPTPVLWPHGPGHLPMQHEAAGWLRLGSALRHCFPQSPLWHLAPSQAGELCPGLWAQGDQGDCPGSAESSSCFQGRNAAEQVKMIQRVEAYNRACPAHQRVSTSVEVEKSREELYQLFGYGDVVGTNGVVSLPSTPVLASWHGPDTAGAIWGWWGKLSQKRPPTGCWGSLPVCQGGGSG